MPDYVISLQTVARACGLGGSDFAIIMQAWMHLDIELRRTIDEPVEGMNLAEYIDDGWVRTRGVIS